MRKVFLIGLLQYWFVQIAFPQNDHYSIRNYTAVDGLPQSQVMGMAEDDNGYIWLGTAGGGLARFDGREFNVYTTYDGLLSNSINAILISSRQELWILHARGVTKFDGLQFKKFQQPDSRGSTAPVKAIYERKDTIFLLSWMGNVSKIYNDSVYYWEKPTLKDQKIEHIHIGPKHEICSFTSDGQCFINTEKETFSIPISHYGKFWKSFNWKNRIILKTSEGFFELNLEKREVIPLSWKMSNDTYVIRYDDKRDFFWTSDGNNLFRETIIAENIRRDTVLKNVKVMDVMVDAEFNTWLSTDGLGLYKYFIQDFDRITPENVRGVMSIAKDRDGDMWIGTMTNGLWRMRDGKFKHYLDSREKRNTNRVVKVSPDGAFVWIGTWYGLGRYEKRTDSFTWYTKDDGLVGNSIVTLEFDDHGGLWIGTQGAGVSYFDGKEFHNFDSSKLPNSVGCWAMYYAPRLRTLFYGTEDGFNMIKDNQASAIPITGLSTVVIGIHPYQDSLLLLATGGSGVMVFNPETTSHHAITYREGLASDFAYFAAEDENHFVWVGTEKGINRIKLNAAAEVTENLHYSYDNGLTGVETNQNAFYFNGAEKYFGLIDGLYAFNDFDTRKKKSFDLHLTGVEILYGEFRAKAYSDSVYGFFKIPYHLVLPPDKNHVTFHFNRVDKRYPNSVKFKYYLENFDKTWSQPSATGQVTYGNLPPGDYIFRVMATDNKGSWADARIAYPFTVKSPFYRRASFILGLLILVSGVITLTLYVRVKQRIKKAVQLERIRAKEQENLRKEIAQDFHDEMGNHLTRIINYISLLKLNGVNGNHSGKQHELYEKVEASAKHLYAGTRDFIWGIDPMNDELSKLFIHIRDFGEKLFEEKAISFRAFNEVKEKIKLPYGFTREANLIFKEAMTNAFKYSDARNVTLSLNHAGERFELILCDDGKGFCFSDIGNSNGLKNIRERADRIDAVLRITSEKDQGTKIALTFKVRTKKKHHGASVQKKSNDR